MKLVLQMNLKSCSALKSGGVVVLLFRITNNGCDISAVMDGYFSKTIHTNIPCIDSIFNHEMIDNSTALVIQDIKENYWTLLTIKFPEVMKGNYLFIYYFEFHILNDAFFNSF